MPKSSIRRASVFAVLFLAVLAVVWVIYKPQPQPTAPRPTTASAPSGAPPLTAPIRPPEVAPSPPTPAPPAPAEVAEPSRSSGRSAAELRAQIDAALRVGDHFAWERILEELFPALAAKDRQEAARLVAALPVNERREQLLRRLARAWATVDFADALGWIATLPEPAERKAAAEDACFQIAQTDPVEALQAWDGLQFGGDDHVMETLVMTWAQKDLPAAQAWVKARPPSLQRDQVVARTAYVMAQSQPADAANFALRELSPGPAQDEAVRSVVYQWFRLDRAAATAWVQQLPTGSLGESARAEISAQSRTP